MRNIWRLIRVLFVTLWHTLYVSVTVRRLPEKDRTVYRAHRQQVGTRILCKILGVKASLRGNVPHERGMLIVSNHIGVLDPLVLASLVPVSFAGKAELRDWPVIGWVTREMGVLFVERERRTQAASFIEELRQCQQDGVHVLVFPEGTTGRGPHVKPFKTGAFAAVANSKNSAIVPLYINPVRVNGCPVDEQNRFLVTWADNRQSFVAHAWQLFGLKNAEFEILVGEPLLTDGYDRKELAARAHESVSALADSRVSSIIP